MRYLITASLKIYHVYIEFWKLMFACCNVIYNILLKVNSKAIYLDRARFVSFFLAIFSLILIDA